MTTPLRVTVPQAHFATPAFWQRLHQTTTAHADHPCQLSGRTDPTNVYDYQCLRCGVVLVEVTVKREGDA